MITVYNLICNNRADQVAIARNIAEQLAAAYNGTDLTAAVEAFAKLYQERKVHQIKKPPFLGVTLCFGNVESVNA